jgi:hypothetical protein
MPPNKPEYIAQNRLYLNKRANLSYHNRIPKISYDIVHEYEKEHGLEKTILWLKIEKLKIKENMFKEIT